MKTRVDPVLGDRAQTWEKIIATSGSKLSKSDYPLVDPMFNVFFQKQKQKDIDPIFAGRLAAFARKNDISIFVGSGYRSYEEQVRCYEESGGKQDKNGNWVGGDGSAAVPGRSWHNNGEAIDISWLGEPSSKYIREDLYGHSASTEEQVKLIEYGIFKPLTSGNGITKKSQLENWHIQPIETRGISDTALCFSGEEENDSLDNTCKPENALLHQKTLAAAVESIAPVLEKVIVEGNQRKVWNCKYPLQYMEIFLVSALSITDEGIFKSDADSRKKHIKALISILAKILDVTEDHFMNLYTKCFGEI